MLPLDDLLVVTRKFINKLAWRSEIDRCLRRHGVTNLRELQSDDRLSPPRRPQTNGMVERFNGRVAEVIKQTRFKSADELELTLRHDADTYDHRIPQRAPNHLSPV